jgi:ABC-2 type transport system permease protein
VLSGLLFWNFISQSTQAAMGELYWSGGLIQRMYLPKSAFAVAAIASAMVNYVVALLPFVLISSALGSLPSPAVLLLPIPLLFAGLFALGVGLAVSSWAMFFADVIPTYEVLLTVWLYLTPIIYPMDVLPAAIQRVLFLNPLTHLLAPFRDILLNGVAPSLSSVALAGALGLLSAAIGWLIFTRRSREYAHVV